MFVIVLMNIATVGNYSFFVLNLWSHFSTKFNFCLHLVQNIIITFPKIKLATSILSYLSLLLCKFSSLYGQRWKKFINFINYAFIEELSLISINHTMQKHNWSLNVEKKNLLFNSMFKSGTLILRYIGGDIFRVKTNIHNFEVSIIKSYMEHVVDLKTTKGSGCN